MRMPTVHFADTAPSWESREKLWAPGRNICIIGSPGECQKMGE